MKTPAQPLLYGKTRQMTEAELAEAMRPRCLCGRVQPVRHDLPPAEDFADYADATDPRGLTRRETLFTVGCAALAGGLFLGALIAFLLFT